MEYIVKYYLADKADDAPQTLTFPGISFLLNIKSE
jgi:hypothetical protein